jgi:protein involved in polysaccharide export with SLBB domain
MLKFPDSIKRTSRLLGVGLAFVAGLSGGPRATAAPDDANHDDKKFSYKLQPLDLLKIQVFQEPDLSRDVRISKNHTIVLPLIGTVDLTNLTVHDAEQLITDLYGRDYLVNPQISITVSEYTQRTLSVLGAVGSPGSVVIPPERDLTLVDAIAHAGGFSRLANQSDVSLTRTLPSGEIQHFTINVDQLIRGNAPRQWIVQDGDVVFVPESVL